MTVWISSAPPPLPASADRQSVASVFHSAAHNAASLSAADCEAAPRCINAHTVGGGGGGDCCRLTVGSRTVDPHQTESSSDFTPDLPPDEFHSRQFKGVAG